MHGAKQQTIYNMDNRNEQPRAIALAYFNAWTTGKIAKAADYLATDITFEMPINEYHTKEAFMNAVAFTAQHATDIKMQTSFGNEHEAILLYEFVFAPIGKLVIAEHFKVQDNKINFIRHVHDTHALRATMQ